jgi:hypothetical protein
LGYKLFLLHPDLIGISVEEVMLVSKYNNRSMKKQLTALSFLVATIITPSTPYASVPKDYNVPVVTCSPRPACLDSNPPCKIAEPLAGWCTPVVNNPTCTPRPACLDSNPPCKIASYFCTPSPTPTPIKNYIPCGGDKKPVICPSGYTCLYGNDIKIGGKCIPMPTPLSIRTEKPVKKGFLEKVWSLFFPFFKR